MSTTWINGSKEYTAPDLYGHVAGEKDNSQLRASDSERYRAAYAELRHLTEAEAFRKIADDLAERDRLDAVSWKLHLAGKDAEADEVELDGRGIDSDIDDYLPVMLRRRYGSACMEEDADDDHHGHDEWCGGSLRSASPG